MADYIKDQAAFDKICKRLRAVPSLGVDTEFVGERSYYPRLALLQLSSGEDVWLIDPLKINDLKPLCALFENPKTTVLMHDAEIDLQILHRATGASPANLFDTQLAAAFAGMAEKTGLSVLVRRFTGKRLSKGQQVTNWLKRPLSQKQLSYAAEDVKYLDKIYKSLSWKLKHLNRLEIFQEEMAHRAECFTSTVDVLDRFKKLFNHSRMTRRRREALKRLLIWREETAKELDKPRRHIISDETVVAIGDQIPVSINELRSLRLISDRAVKRYGSRILAISSEVADIPDEREPGAPRKKSNGKRVSSRIPLVKMALEVLASEAGIAPGLIARRDDIESICRASLHSDSPPDIPALSGWRGRLVGEKLWRIARGELSMRVGRDPGGPSVIIVE